MLTLSTPSSALPPNLLYEVDFAVEDVKSMKDYLASEGVEIQKGKNKNANFVVVIDPEGHRIGFAQQPPTDKKEIPGLESVRLIHAGFVVQDRAAEDRFYKDILGFHVYWHGGMKDGEDNWVDMQVPDGTDWIEYMLRVSPDASHKTLGVMNHIALGVPDIHAAQQQLIKNGWKGTEEPKIGRDGKWQLNLYDPDETRVELMEFKPTKEPCCSSYTGPHPTP
jgi:catechol 2,3-dioxygenase-like lactoylglutathione lyase family enzyme